jgi:hypothetical protein
MRNFVVIVRHSSGKTSTRFESFASACVYLGSLGLDVSEIEDAQDFVDSTHVLAYTRGGDPLLDCQALLRLAE